MDFEGQGVYISDETLLRVLMAQRYDFDTQKQEYYLTDAGKRLAELIDKHITEKRGNRG